MRKHTSIGRRIAGVAAGAGIAAASVVTMSTPAQAYSPDPEPDVHVKSTDDCPGAEGCTPGDVIDGTYFKDDNGGQAVKIGLWDSGNYVGKVEYHPYGEHLYVYDNHNDGDAIYTTLTHYLPSGRPITTGPYKGSSSMSSIHTNLSHREGTPIYVKVWDDKDQDDLIAEATAVA